MDCYDIWSDLKDGRRDLEFAEAVRRYLDDLRARGLVEGWRLTRRKLGFGPEGLGEFHIRIETRDLAQLDLAFRRVATRAPDVESLHGAVYALATNFRAGLSRDFPDPERG